MRACVVVMILALSTPARAQEFVAPTPAGPAGVSAILEHGLPPVGAEARIEALAARWHGLPELAARSIAYGAGWRELRWAVGLSRFGDGELGWSAVAVATGLATEAGGAALRLCARRDAPGNRGVECGGGAWAPIGRHARLWAAVPQLWTEGEPPPLARWLEIGAIAEGFGIKAWLSRTAVPSRVRGVRADHFAGIAADTGPITTWVSLRDRPPRGSLGVTAARGALRLGVEVESHPVLPETVRLGVSWGSR